MKKLYLAAAALFLSLGSAAHALDTQPIPGSLIYPAQPRTKLQKAPAGSTFEHRFERNGMYYRETYRIEPNRDLKLLRRWQVSKS